MPYPNEHACRLEEPNTCKPDSYRREKRKHDGKEYSVIFCADKGSGSFKEQAYRYNKEIWSESEAKAHCKNHEGKFEAAQKEKIMNINEKFYISERIHENKTEGRHRVRATSRVIDRHNTIIEPIGVSLETMKRTKNAPVLWAHTSGGFLTEAKLPIGKILLDTIEQTNDYLDVDIQLDMKDPFAREVDRKINDGILNTVSIGFIPKKMKRPEGAENENEPTIIMESELVELSVVPIPSNPDAVILERKILDDIQKCIGDSCHSKETDESSTTRISIQDIQEFMNNSDLKYIEREWVNELEDTLIKIKNERGWIDDNQIDNDNDDSKSDMKDELDDYSGVDTFVKYLQLANFYYECYEETIETRIGKEISSANLKQLKEVTESINKAHETLKGLIARIEEKNEEKNSEDYARNNKESDIIDEVFGDEFNKLNELNEVLESFKDLGI